MASNIDNRIVNMKFNNKDFQKGISTTLTSLKSLKQGLDLSGVTKGLDDVSRRTDMSSKSMTSFANAAQSVSDRFSLLDIVGVTALVNIANSAVNAGKRLLSSLTVEPILTGLTEYETKMNAITTIMTNTNAQQAKVSQTSINNINASADAAVKAVSETVTGSSSSIRKYQKEQIKAQQKLANDEIDIIDDKYEKEITALDNAIDDELTLLTDAHDDKLKMYNEEYLEKLRVIDEEKYNRIKAIDAEIDKINGLTEAEEEALKTQREQAKLAELAADVASAIDTESRIDAERDLAEYRAELQRDALLESRDATIEGLELAKDVIQQEYEEEVTQMQAHYEALATEESALYASKLENMQMEQAEQRNLLVETYKTEREQMSETHALAMENIREAQSAQAGASSSNRSAEIEAIYAKRDAELAALSEVAKATEIPPTTLEEVNKALAELNEYADLTIYNFADMTRNIGTFTAAGVDLETSVSSIKGIANLAAGSGSNAQQASTAMYQLSQAIAQGQVRLQDWNSVANAGLGGSLFQNALKETASDMGIFVDDMIPFRLSLESGWLSTEVLTETLDRLSKDESLVAAATQVKTFTQLMSVMAESVQSGWAVTWENILGDSDQSKEFFTAISEGFQSLIAPSANARNAALEFWNANGGRTALIEGMTNVLQGLADIFKPISDGFKELFPPITGEQLVAFSEGFRDLTEDFKMGESYASNIAAIFTVLGSGADFAKNAVISLKDGVKALIGPLSLFETISDGVVTGVTYLIDVLKKVGAAIKENFNLDVAVGATGITGIILIVKKLSDFLGSLKGNTQGFKDFLNDSMGGLLDTLQAYQTSVKANTILMIAAAIGILAVSLSLLSGISPEELGGAVAALSVLLIEVFGATGILTNISTSKGFLASGAIVATLLGISAAMLVLSGALKVMDGLDSEKMYTSVGVIGLLMSELVIAIGGLKLIGGTGGLISIGVTMIAISFAVKKLADTLSVIGKEDPETLTKGLAAIAALLLSIGIFTRVVDKVGVLTGAGMILIAIAVDKLVDSVKGLGSIDPKTLAIGIGAITAVLLSLAVATRLMPTTLSLIAPGVLVMAGALLILQKSIMALGSMDPAKLATGLLAMLGILAAIAGFSALTPATLIITASGVFILATAMLLMAKAIDTFGSMDISTLAIGLGALVLVLGILGVAGYLLTPVVPVLLGLGVAILLLSTGVFLAAAGISLLAGAIALLAGVSVTSVAAITALIVAIVTGLALGIVEMVKVVRDNAPIFGEAFLVLITTALKVIVETIPAIIETFFTLLVTLLEAVVEYTPEIVGAFAQILIEFLLTIAEYLPAIIDAGVKLIIAFIHGLAAALEGNAEELKQAIYDLFKAIVSLALSILTDDKVSFGEFMEAARGIVQSIVDGVVGAYNWVVDGFKELVGKGVTAVLSFRQGFKDAGIEIVMGLVDGIASLVGKVGDAVSDVGTAALDGLKDLLDINSPSKETTKVGEWFSKGLINGIQTFASKVKMAGALVGDNAKTGLTNAIKNVGDFLNSDLDLAPVIRPVIDLTNIKKASTSMSGLFGVTLSDHNSTIKAQLIDSSKSTDIIQDIINTLNKPDPKPGQGGVSVTNTFTGPITVREEADIKNVARELYQLQVAGQRG